MNALQTPPMQTSHQHCSQQEHQQASHRHYWMWCCVVQPLDSVRVLLSAVNCTALLVQVLQRSLHTASPNQRSRLLVPTKQCLPAARAAFLAVVVPQAVAGDGHGAGRASIRSSSWAQTARRSARRFGNEMALFLRSNNWRCTYVSTATCVGNLESTHNEIHNVVGGTGGELT